MQILSGEDGFHRAKIGPGADERFIRALAQQKLQRANDDRLARAGFSRNADKAWSDLPLEFFHEREILDSQQGEDRRHYGSREFLVES